MDNIPLFFGAFIWWGVTLDFAPRAPHCTRLGTGKVRCRVTLPLNFWAPDTLGNLGNPGNLGNLGNPGNLGNLGNLGGGGPGVQKSREGFTPSLEFWAPASVEQFRWGSTPTK